MKEFNELIENEDQEDESEVIACPANRVKSEVKELSETDEDNDLLAHDADATEVIIPSM